MDQSFAPQPFGLYSTTEDLFLWDKALTTSQLLSKDLMEIMVTPKLSSYSCGWVTNEILGRKCVNHFGDISGFFSDFLRFVDNKVTIIILSNMNVTPVTHLSRELAKIIFEENVTLPSPIVPVPFSLKGGLDSILGDYHIKNATSHILNISVNSDGLYLTVPKLYGVLYKFKLVTVSHNSTQTVFLTEMINEQIVFYYSLAREIERVEYTDYYGINHTVYKAK
jgi:hypothetical protein